MLRYYDDVTGVDVNDVFLRGVKRRRPANSNGEELRDVIIWLIALQYAEREKRQIALISNDGGFWNDAEIHEHLKQDIVERKVNISLFRNIDDFIKSSAPQPKSVDEAYASKAFDVAKLTDEIIATAKKALATWKRLFQPFTIRFARLESVKFTSGTVYEIDAETQFAEFSYELFITTHLAFTEQSFVQPSIGTLLMGPQSVRHVGFAVPAPAFPGHQMYTPGLGLGFGKTAFGLAQALRTVVKTYAVSANAQIFVRLVKGKPSEVEVNRVEITKAEETAAAEEAPPLDA